jgi:hypothetical protein
MSALGLKLLEGARPEPARSLGHSSERRYFSRRHPIPDRFRTGREAISRPALSATKAAQF